MNFLPDRAKALQNLADRVPLQGMIALSNTLIQTEKYGTPLAQSLRILSGEMREERIMAAESKAAKLPATLTIPMILFILPPLFIVLIGPLRLKVKTCTGIDVRLWPEAWLWCCLPCRRALWIAISTICGNRAISVYLQLAVNRRRLAQDDDILDLRRVRHAHEKARHEAVARKIGEAVPCLEGAIDVVFSDAGKYLMHFGQQRHRQNGNDRAPGSVRTTPNRLSTSLSETRHWLLQTTSIWLYSLTVSITASSSARNSSYPCIADQIKARAAQ